MRELDSKEAMKEMSITDAEILQERASVATLAFDRGTLVLSGRPRANLADLPFRWDGRTRQWRCHALHYRAIRRAMGEGVQDILARPPQIRWPACELPALRPDQESALEAWQAAGGRGQIIMPTGTGKTVVALAAMARCAISTLVVAPIRDLMYQWHRRIRKTLGYEAGILGDGLHEIRPVTVTTYDSAYLYMDRIGDRFGLVVFDEEHHLPGPNLRQAAEFCAAELRLGLTATPERFDGAHSGLDVLIGPVVYRQEIPEARGNVLAEYDTVRVPIALTDDEQRRYDLLSRCVRAFMFERRKHKPDYRWEEACRDSGRDPEVRDALAAFHAKAAIETRAAEKLRVLEDLFRLHAHERVLVFTGSNRMAMDVSLRFLIPMIIDKTGKKERREILDGFENGRYQAIVANQVLDEGVDVPSVKIGVVLGGFASTRQAKQRLGRILRKQGRATAVLYEVVCQETREETRSRARRRSDAYQGTRSMRL
jgi:superfamily II DNA or RNA helicase